MNNKEVVEKVQKEKIEFLYLLFTDITGQPKKVTIPASMISGTLQDGAWFDGSSIEGFARIYESDMQLQPDPDTFSILPWTREDGRCALTGGIPLVMGKSG